MTIWSPKIHENARVKYQGIVDAIETDIKAHRLKPGDKLPAQRQIAQALNIDLTTVTRAINEAVKRGLVETHPGSGCFIAQTAFSHYNAINLTAGKPLDLSMNNPPSPPDICLQTLIAQTMQSSQGFVNRLCYQETAGHPHDRQAGTNWLKNKIANIDPNSVLIASGAHSAIFSVLLQLQQNGATAVAAPEFCYPGLRSIADQLGLDVYSVAMDAEGIQIESLVAVLQKYQPAALYLTPNIDNPTTTTLPIERRQAIANLARDHQVNIIEDDPYFSFLDAPLPSLYSLAPELTWHIATLSKCVSPALRVAYIVSPSLAQALTLAEVMRVSSIMASPLLTAVVSQWIENKQIDAISTAIKQENSKRQALATSILGTQPRQIASPHLWIGLPRGMRALDYCEQASRYGVSVVPSTAFVTTRSQLQAVRISLGVTADYSSLSNGLSLLAELLISTQKHTKFII